MKRICAITAITALALGAGAGSALAGNGKSKPDKPKPNQVAAKMCQAEKKADKQAFREKYGKHAMRECKRAQRGEAKEMIRNASQECRAEREADPEGFAETYGSNHNNRNAFGKCVSGKVKEDAAEEPSTGS